MLIFIIHFLVVKDKLSLKALLPIMYLGSVSVVEPIIMQKITADNTINGLLDITALLIIELSIISCYIVLFVGCVRYLKKRAGQYQ
jgi:hypothetical protein